MPHRELDIHSAPRFICTIGLFPTHRDSDSRSCLCKWSPIGYGFVPDRFVLCHVQSADERITLRKVEIARSCLINKSRKLRYFFFFQLMALERYLMH